MPDSSDRLAKASRVKPTRIFLGTDKRAIAPAELNQLFQKAGLPIRPADKLAIALEHSLFCVVAWTFKEKKLVGFVRATSDGVFNTTIWDLVVDPALPNREATTALLLTRLKRDVAKVIPNCAISVFANPQDYDLLRQANFAEDRKGIQAMILLEEDAPLAENLSESISHP